MICNTGKSTIYEDLAESICRYFEKHPFVKIGVKGRPAGTSVASVVEQIEVRFSTQSHSIHLALSNMRLYSLISTVVGEHSSVADWYRTLKTSSTLID